MLNICKEKLTFFFQFSTFYNISFHVTLFINFDNFSFTKRKPYLYLVTKETKENIYDVCNDKEGSHGYQYNQTISYGNVLISKVGCISISTFSWINLCLYDKSQCLCKCKHMTWRSAIFVAGDRIFANFNSLLYHLICKSKDMIFEVDTSYLVLVLGG